MSDNKPLHPGLRLTEIYIEALDMPVSYVAKISGIQLELATAFFDGVAKLNRAQAEQMEELLNGWRTADWIMERQ